MTNEARYARIRSRSHARTDAAFDAAVAAYLAAHDIDQTAENFLAAAKLVSFPCRRCAGTGAFITGSLNGKPTGPGGVCFRCSGKGAQTDADARRNYGADLHQRVA